jgi:uncharacterized repeat protein (TIGR04138 family)
MPQIPDPLIELFERDKRYRPEAYAFVFEALAFAQTQLGMGREKPSEPMADEPVEEQEEREGPERHVTGQELCEAIRCFALDQYGLMAKCVLNSWGVHNTGDFGEIVFNLIGAGRMRKTPEDRREDFDNVYDFETGLNQAFRITLQD